MPKIHFAPEGSESPLCRPKGRTSAVTRRVTCLSCQYKDEFEAAKATQEAAAQAAFEAQEPRTVVPMFGRVNSDGVMDCYSCGGVLWREKPRSSWSFHYVCAGCGTSVHPLTETGMCS